ncbi:MAG: hypothetical protein HY347_05920 [candidate division NC10 bacterium]|nr:hypothetical protein [candidate division NC10 bacterium]
MGALRERNGRREAAQKPRRRIPGFSRSGQGQTVEGTGRRRGVSPATFSQTGRSTIVEYSADKAPCNDYPRKLVSPPAPKRCCQTHMERIGGLHRDGSWRFYYKRCTKCGFTVRVGDSKDMGELFESLRKDLVGRKG